MQPLLVFTERGLGLASVQVTLPEQKLGIKQPCIQTLCKQPVDRVIKVDKCAEKLQDNSFAVPGLVQACTDVANCVACVK